MEQKGKNWNRMQYILNEIKQFIIGKVFFVLNSLNNYTGIQNTVIQNKMEQIETNWNKFE